MSIKTSRSNVNASKVLTNPPISPVWTRNPSWLAMPATTSSDERVDMLVAVYPESNYIAFTFNTSAGSYTVDWGDGTSPVTVASGTAAQYLYSFATAGLANTNGPVTFTDSGDTVNRTAHGYTDGMTISFDTVVTTTGITAGQIYYVINSTANTFQVSATQGGSAIALTLDGSGTILPHKQAVISVTPTTGGATFSTVNLQVKNTTSNLQGYAQPILDLTISANCSTLTIASGSTVPMFVMERCTILRHNTVDMTSLFSNCYNLQSVPLFNTASVTNTSAMFSNCRSLQLIPLLNTVSSTTMASMFSGCLSLVSLPLLNSAAATNMTSMFSGCASLAIPPLLNTASVTNMTSMFNGCTDLVTVPLFNTSAVTNMQTMFNACSSLRTVPLFNTVSLTSMQSMFAGCTSLVTVPLFNTASVTNMISAFSACSSLRTVPLFNTSAVTNMNTMFATCTSLLSVPLFNTSAVTSFNSTFSGCSALRSIPAFSTTATTGAAFPSFVANCSSLQQVPDINFSQTGISGVPAYTSMFSSCPSLSKINCTIGPKFTFTVANLKLSAAALDALYTSLPVVVSQTITVSGNVGIAADTPLIATAKGWTVTGS